MNRNEREARSLAEVDRLAVNIRQARNINRGVVIALLVMAALLAGFNWAKPADAAKRAVYKGTVTICYAPTTRAPKIDQYLFTQWQVEAAVKAAGPSIGKVRVVKERYPHTTCYGEVYLWSAPEAYAYGQNVSRTAPYGVYRYGEAGVMWESQIVMGDKVGAKATAAQRQAWLVAALRVAIPR